MREKVLFEKFTWNGVIPLWHSPGMCRIVSKANSEDSEEVMNKVAER